MSQVENIMNTLEKAVYIWGQKEVANTLNVERETVNRWLKKKGIDELNINFKRYNKSLQSLLPQKPKDYDKSNFDFIDLFAGIGGLRRTFNAIGGKCVFTSEWDDYAKRTYLANYYDEHEINGDIKDITEGHRITKETGLPVEELTEDEISCYIDTMIPDHDVLLAGFPCQPFSIAGVSKKNALGRSHGFDCKIQGTLFYDICKVLKVKKPACFLLENVKNLKSHNKGDTYRTIIAALKDAGYIVPEPRVINGKEFLPQNRERIILAGFRNDLEIGSDFDLNKVKPGKNEVINRLGDLLEKPEGIEDKYTLTDNLWKYLQGYKKKHRANGNGFGYDIFTPDSEYTRTLSARYYKDGSEILIAQSKLHVTHCENGKLKPRRLTPRECSRLMGFDKPGKSDFNIPVSDTRAYKQFGNSVIVPVFDAVAKHMKNYILESVKRKQELLIDETNSHSQ